VVITCCVEDKDASQKALEQVEKMTESERAKGEDLLCSEGPETPAPLFELAQWRKSISVENAIKRLQRPEAIG